MIDTKKLVDAINIALNGLRRHAEVVNAGLSHFPDDSVLLVQKGKSVGGREILDALLVGIERGRFDAEPDAQPGPLYSEDIGEDTEDMDDEAPEEARVKYGAFVANSVERFRSFNVSEDFDTRLEAWTQIYKTGDDGLIYEVRPL